jgi:hypothetical protein
MKSIRTKFLFVLVLCLGMIFVSSVVFAAVLEKKTIKRLVDPVVMDGGLASDVIGRPIANLRIYAFHDGKFEPIRYQIDEMTGVDGDWIYTEGPKPNKELANGKFDSWDKVVFMASDTGDKVGKEQWVSGYTNGVEIEVIDPVTGEKGWCYLLYFQSSPPARSSLPNYHRYDYATNSHESERYHKVDIITKDGLHTTFYKSWCITELAGGNEKNFIDRLKIRPELRLMFGKVPIRFTEEILKSDTMAFTTGPVRVNKRVEQYIKVGNMKFLRALSDIGGYRDIFAVPVTLQIPMRVDTVASSFVIRFATDFSPEVIGSKTSLSSDPDHWYQINGKMDDDEINFNAAPFDKWRVLTGEWGTFMTRALFPPEVLQYVTITRGIIDDDSIPNPPETYPGCLGMAYQDWHLEKAPRGLYHFYLDFYVPSNYKPGDEFRYADYQDNPLKIRVKGKEGVNLTMPVINNLSKKYK